MPRVNSKNSQTKQSHSGSGFVRIIAGKWRGRKLPVKNVEGLRPTSDRVKETVFNWLQTDIYQANCLDLFAGSGSLGFEALSRNANQVTFVEKDTKAHLQLSENIKYLQADNSILHHIDAFEFLTNPPSSAKPYHLVFIDPPFRQDQLENICEKLNSSELIASNGLIYVETELQTINLPSSWQLLKEKKAGQVYFRLYRKEK